MVLYFLSQNHAVCSPNHTHTLKPHVELLSQLSKGSKAAAVSLDLL